MGEISGPPLVRHLAVFVAVPLVVFLLHLYHSMSRCREKKEEEMAYKRRITDFANYTDKEVLRFLHTTTVRRF
jgi:hypothetical protein